VGRGARGEERGANRVTNTIRDEEYGAGELSRHKCERGNGTAEREGTWEERELQREGEKERRRVPQKTGPKGTDETKHGGQNKKRTNDDREKKKT
jgi:hypothetical protein